jgi:stearoyl-CoA desaturase (delta-9 desaturase)
VGVLRGGQEVEVWKDEVRRPMKEKTGKLVTRAGEQVTRV